jgi:uroporphyrinogen-III synthase
MERALIQVSPCERAASVRMVHVSIQAAYDLYVTVCRMPMPQSDRQHAQSLAGSSVIVTRPGASASALVRSARLRGAVVIRLPGLRIAVTDNAVAARSALAAAVSADFWIFTSPNAVRFERQLAAGEPFPDTVGVLAVGSGTQRALVRYGIASIAPGGAQNSEGLLADSILNDVQGKAITIIDAPGGRDLLAPELRKRGARVERIAVYQRLPPRLQPRHLSALAAAPRPWISLLSSSAILENLLDALPPDLLQRWQQEALIVSSERLATQARAAGFNDVHEARSALGADLIDAAERSLSRHRI